MATHQQVQEWIMNSAEIYFRKTLAVFDGDSVAVDMMTYPTETLCIVYTMRGNYKEAIRWFDEALRISIELNKKQGIVDFYKRKHEAFLKLEIPDSSQFYLSKYTILNDSLKNAEKSAIPTLVKKLKTVQENIIYKLNTWVWILVMGALLFLFIVFILWNRYLKSKRLHSSKDKQLSNKLLRIKKLSEEIEQKSKLTIEDLIQLATESKPAFLIAF